MAITSLGTFDCDYDCDEVSATVYVNKFGGKPKWLIQNTEQSLYCAECQGQIIFLGQMYCPVKSMPTIDRVLYIFFCPMKSCIKAHKSWVVIRCQAESIILEEKKVEVKSVFDLNIESMDWGEEPSDGTLVTQLSNKQTEDSKFLDSTAEKMIKSSFESAKSEALVNEFSTKLNLVSKQSVGDCNKSKMILMPFHSSYINFNDEDEFIDEVFSVEERLKKYLETENMTLEELEGVKEGKNSLGNVENGKEVSLKDMAPIQGKFFKVLKKCPNQVIRYSYNGQPLQYNSLGGLNVPPCSCGSPRVYEFQIMPAVRTSLMSGIQLSEDVLEGLDIGSVYVYTCLSNCWTQGTDVLKREFVLTHYDDTVQENVALRRGGGRYKL